MTNRIEATADTNTQKLLRELKNVVKEAEGLLANGAHDSSLLGEEARSKLSASLEAAKATYNDLQDRVVAGARKTDKFVHENPYPAIGVAFGLGALLGYLVTRNSK